MAQFSVKTGQIRPLAGDESKMAQELSGYADSIGRIANSLNFHSGAAVGIRARLKSASQKTASHRAGMSGLSSALTAIMDRYDDAERRIANRIGEQSGQSDVWNDFLSELGRNYDVQDLLRSAYKGLIGIATGILGFNVFASWGSKLLGNVWETIGRWIGKGNTTDTTPTAQWVKNVGTTAGTVIGGAMPAARAGTTTTGTVTTGTPSYKQPEYAQKNLALGANGNYSASVTHRDGSVGSVSYRNKDGNLSCTYYTLRKLKERGLGYPCTGGPGNGRDWYKNFDKESGLPHYPGQNALNDLVNNLTLPQENVVVSFSPNHVLLIDKIYKEGDTVKVKYSDMFPVKNEAGTGRIRDLNGSNPPQEKTLSAFVSAYKRYGYPGINGAAVIGAGK